MTTLLDDWRQEPFWSDIGLAAEADPPLRSIAFTAALSLADMALLGRTVQQHAAWFRTRLPFLDFGRLQHMCICRSYEDAVTFLASVDAPIGALECREDEAVLGLCAFTAAGVVVVVHADVIACLLNSAAPVRARGLQILTHELCHLHDMGQRHRWMGPNAEASIDFRLRDLCHLMWSEFFASRFNFTPKDDLEVELDCLAASLAKLPQLSSGNATNLVVARFGYALGGLAAAGTSLDRARPQLVDNLRACGVWPAWMEAEARVQELLLSGECWRHKFGVMRLVTAVRLISNHFKYRSQPAAGSGRLSR